MWVAWAALGLARLPAAPEPVPVAGDDWPVYLGDNASSHYSTLDQINTQNVAQLKIAWIWSSHDSLAGQALISCNPLEVGGVLYCTSPRANLFAVDAATGKTLWRFEPFPGKDGGLNRGLTYWSEGEDRRIYFGAGRFLFAVDARTGRLVPSFADGGRLNLSVGLGDTESKMMVLARSPGIIYRNLIIMPIKVGEGPDAAAAGTICAYDVRSGRLVWSFHTIPQPGEFGYDTWPPDAWKYTGGANVWSGLALDEARGLVFCPTGSATFDHWGGNRAGDNLFSDCLIALKADTGERAWHYQMTRHDIWDRDLPASPNLVTVRRDGREIPAVAQITKTGHVYVFNRETGESLFPIVEEAAPASDMPGEVTARFQPRPLKPEPFSRQRFGPEDLTDISPAAHQAVLEQYKKVRPHAPYAAPSREGTIIFPGFAGGGEWGGAAVDPDGILYVNGQDMPWILNLVDATRETTRGGQVYARSCVVCHGLQRGGKPSGTAPSLTGVSQRLSAEATREVVQNGRSGMPSFAFLGNVNVEAVVDYIRDEAPTASPDGAPVAAKPGDVPFTSTGHNQWLDPEGYPAVKPPWGTLNAIDLNTGEYLWRRTLGEHPELTARGIPPTGTENFGGPIVTAGGLLFIGSTKDEMFRAFDRKTGRELWKMRLPAGGYATPSTYAVNGRQYIVIACGGGRMGTKRSDTYVAFALPPAP